MDHAAGRDEIHRSQEEKVNATDLMSFLGHSSIYEPFDKFLADVGVQKRPKVGRSLDTIIPAKGEGLSMSFEIDAKGRGVVQKSEGNFVFYRLEIMLLEKGQDNGIYSGQLPYNLLATDSRGEVESKLKNLKRRLPDGDDYFVDGLVWTVAFDAEKLRFFQVFVPTDGMRKRGLCD